MRNLSIVAVSAAALLGLSACADSSEQDDMSSDEQVDVDIPQSPVEVVDTETGEDVDLAEDGLEAMTTDGTSSVTADVEQDESGKKIPLN